VKEYKTLPPQQAPPTYTSPTSYKSYRPVLSDDEILYTKGRRLWGTLPSIGFPLLAFIVMNGLILGILFAIILIVPSIDFARSIINNPFFLVFTTLAELILILIPIWYVKKYLNNPSLENRLTLLGFTTKGYERNEIFKEVLIGIAFAFVGILVVVGASLGMELILRYVFGVRIIREGAGNDVEVIITGMDVLVLILIILMMIFIVGPCEEILFRGFMMKGLTRTLGDTWGLIVTAFIFAIIHLVGLLIYIFDPIIFWILFFYIFAPYFAISLMLGFLYKWREENLVAVIVTHGVYNSLTILIAFLFMVFY
jgi:membrane protease YdiL (CAAX protease family)